MTAANPLLSPHEPVSSSTTPPSSSSSSISLLSETLLHDEDHDGCWRLRVKTSKKDTEITVRGWDTVALVKEKSLQALDAPAHSYIRLIAKGRLLAPDEARLDQFPSLQAGDILHAVISDRKGAQASLTHHVRRRGAGVNAQGIAVRHTGDFDEESTSDSVENGQERLGFDRLRATGLRRAEISAIRGYFSRQVDQWIRLNPELANSAAGSETDLVRRRMLQEDAWMRAQGPASEFRLNLTGVHRQLSEAQSRRSLMSTSVGTDRDFMWGFMLGFFVGFFMLLWVWIPSVPHKQKLGIM